MLAGCVISSMITASSNVHQDYIYVMCYTHVLQTNLYTYQVSLHFYSYGEYEI